MLLLAASGVGHAVVTGVENGIGRVDAFTGMSNRPGGGDGLNFLVVGTDGRDKLTPARSGSTTSAARPATAPTP